MEENFKRLIFVLLLFCLSAKVVKGGYYKIRAPPPPPAPPASIHYGPHPPAHHPHPYRIHPPHPPKHLPPAHLQSYHHPHGRIHHKSFTHRDFQQRIPPPLYPQSFSAKALHKIPPVYQWKNFNTFRAPIVKETFNPPPTPYIPSYIKDDDKGPIHTIPAPNLSPADKPSVFLKQNEFYSHQGHKKQTPEDDLVAVLKHGIEKVNIPHNLGYQVTEDPSLHQPNSDKPSYFAPDPDPSVPTLKVPATTDPHSVPSNGQVPLDVYLQQEADKIEAQHHETENNALTAQDLFNLMNYQQGSVNILPSTHLPVYNPEQFTPQFQTFNYEEQTQQGAYGSNSFPTSSMGLQLNTDLAGFEDFKDNDVEGSEKEEVYHKVNENEIVQEKKKDKKETFSKNSSTKVSPSPYYKPTTEEPTTTTTAKEVKPEENVQLQKSIQIYENYTKEEKKDGKTGRGLVVAEITPETINSQADVGGSQIPFGTRLRPKRF